MTEFNNKHPSI